MKTIFFALTAILMTGLSFSQNSEGKITYTIEMSSDDPQMEMAAQMMNGSTLEISFNETGSITKMDMGAMMSLTTTFNGKDVLILMGGMMGKKAIKTTKEELLKTDDPTTDFEVELTNETKEIAGYSCKKAILSDNEGSEIEYWYSEEFVIPNQGQANANGLIPGVALEFKINKGGMLMSYTATSIEEKLADDVTFDLTVPEGYDEMTMEDMQSLGM